MTWTSGLVQRSIRTSPRFWTGDSPSRRSDGLWLKRCRSVYELLVHAWWVLYNAAFQCQRVGSSQESWLLTDGIWFVRWSFSVTSSAPGCFCAFKASLIGLLASWVQQNNLKTHISTTLGWTTGLRWDWSPFTFWRNGTDPGTFFSRSLMLRDRTSFHTFVNFSGNSVGTWK